MVMTTTNYEDDGDDEDNDNEGDEGYGNAPVTCIARAIVRTRARLSSSDSAESS